MNMRNLIENKTLGEIIDDFPIASDFVDDLNIGHLPENMRLGEALETVDEDYFEEYGTKRSVVPIQLAKFLETFVAKEQDSMAVRSISVAGGVFKDGTRDTSDFTVSSGEVISIVGPTGSGKSRLLEDIECIAQGDTPTGRWVLVNGNKVEDEERFGMEGKLVAQLSQNMNFVMDLTVKGFLEMHSQSRMTPNADEIVKLCWECANDLVGEKFDMDVKITQLSGGQSRALMIADTAYMSASPIVLIDEIENAGIDRKKAIDLLSDKEKIVFVATHDPLLALSADRRIVISNGGIKKIIQVSSEEKACLEEITLLDDKLLRLRECLRKGEIISHVGDI